MQTLMFEEFVGGLSRRPCIGFSKTGQSMEYGADLPAPVKDVQIFIFSPSSDPTIPPEELPPVTDIALPFKTIWCEMDGGLPFTIEQIGEGNRRLERVGVKTAPGMDIDCRDYGFLIHENSPGNYVFVLHTILTGKVETGEPIQTKSFTHVVTPWSVAYEDYKILCGNLIQRIYNKSETGAVRVGRKVKLKTVSGKEFIKIRDVILVRPKGGEKEFAGHRDVEWNYRFRVRGHWRKTDGTGKDRAGEYSVKGFAWVNDYIKGPEGKELIEKARVVHV